LLPQNEAVLKAVKLLLLLFVICGTAHSCLPQAQRPASAQTTIPPEDRIDINHASIEQLMKIPGITRVWAGRIVRFRPYRAKNDLINHGIIPGEIYSRIKGYIVAHREPQ
jgi:DNA uptake protein ComE-like DNA-binding protein